MVLHDISTIDNIIKCCYLLYVQCKIQDFFRLCIKFEYIDLMYNVYQCVIVLSGNVVIIN